MTRTLSVALITAACGSTTPAVEAPPPPPPAVVVDAAPPLPLDQDLPRLAERGTALMQEIADGLTAAGADCAAAVVTIDRITDANAEVIAANRKVFEEGRLPELRKAMGPTADANDRAASTIVDSEAFRTCASDPAFQTSFGRLTGVAR